MVEGPGLVAVIAIVDLVNVNTPRSRNLRQLTASFFDTDDMLQHGVRNDRIDASGP